MWPPPRAFCHSTRCDGILRGSAELGGPWKRTLSPFRGPCQRGMVTVRASAAQDGAAEEAASAQSSRSARERKQADAAAPTAVAAAPAARSAADGAGSGLQGPLLGALAVGLGAAVFALGRLGGGPSLAALEAQSVPLSTALSNGRPTVVRTSSRMYSIGRLTSACMWP